MLPWRLVSALRLSNTGLLLDRTYLCSISGSNQTAAAVMCDWYDPHYLSSFLFTFSTRPYRTGRNSQWLTRDINLHNSSVVAARRGRRHLLLLLLLLLLLSLQYPCSHRQHGDGKNAAPCISSPWPLCLKQWFGPFLPISISVVMFTTPTLTFVRLLPHKLSTSADKYQRPGERHRSSTTHWMISSRFARGDESLSHHHESDNFKKKKRFAKMHKIPFSLMSAICSPHAHIRQTADLKPISLSCKAVLLFASSL